MYSLLNAGSPCCGTCKYFKRMDVAEETDTDVEIEDYGQDAREYGRCTRYPPVFFHPGLLNAEFPVVSESTLCGEYKRDIE